jgi:hypothetical protein
MNSIKKLNEQLSMGILPDELNFGIKREYELDINKIKYNAFYRSYEFYEKKFPKGYEGITGFDKIIENIAYTAQEKNKSPLQELDEIEKELKQIEEEIQQEDQQIKDNKIIILDD